jgi:transposase-like protein
MKRITEFALCPMCSSSNAIKLSWTWWGGKVGPYLLNHVKCEDCGATYNGKTGKSNKAPIIIYQVVVCIFTLASLSFWWRLNS